MNNYEVYLNNIYWGNVNEESEDKAQFEAEKWIHKETFNFWKIDDPISIITKKRVYL